MKESRVSAFVQRHERHLIVLWLVSCLVALFLMGFVGLYRGVLDGGIRALDRRWPARYDQAAELVAEGRLEEAVVRLEQLDARFPAVWVKNRGAPIRERILELLGTTQAELGHKKRAIATHERLVDFDPRRWRSHFMLAETSRRFGETETADESYARVLDIHPTHLPSVAARIEMRFESGLYAEVPELYEAYLDAWLLVSMELSLGDTHFTFDVPVDGRAHTLEVVSNLGADWGGELRLATKGYSVEIESMEFIEPARVGVTTTRATHSIDGLTGWSARAMTRAGARAWAANSVESLLRRRVTVADVARVRLTLTAFKATGESPWGSIETCYRNLLDLQGLAAARARTVIGGCAEGGSIFPDL